MHSINTVYTLYNAQKILIIVLFLHRIWVSKHGKRCYFLSHMQKFETLFTSCAQLPYAHHWICAFKNYKSYSGVGAWNNTPAELRSIVREPLGPRNRPFSKNYFAHSFFISKPQLLKFSMNTVKKSSDVSKLKTYLVIIWTWRYEPSKKISYFFSDQKKFLHFFLHNF